MIWPVREMYPSQSVWCSGLDPLRRPSDYVSAAKIGRDRSALRSRLLLLVEPMALNRPGFFTGSGIPMRFADVDGTTIDTTGAHYPVNESGMTYPAAIEIAARSSPRPARLLRRIRHPP